MLAQFTAKYHKISTGYIGQILEWPEVITEGETIDECRLMLQDALHEMTLAYRQLNKEIPETGFLFENLAFEIDNVS
jgi:predicted RNase H-like HicB family nuclease